MSRKQQTTKRIQRTTLHIDTPLPTPRATLMVFTPCGHETPAVNKHRTASHLVGRFAYCVGCGGMRVVEKVV